jgi:hypothetical protein
MIWKRLSICTTDQIWKEPMRNYAPKLELTVFATESFMYSNTLVPYTIPPTSLYTVRRGRFDYRVLYYLQQKVCVRANAYRNGNKIFLRRIGREDGCELNQTQEKKHQSNFHFLSVVYKRSENRFGKQLRSIS